MGQLVPLQSGNNDAEKSGGKEQGLMLTFKDPRAVIPCLKLLQAEMRYGRLLGPLIIDAEVLPGPGGFLPGMASVFKNAPKELPGSDLEDPPIPGDLQDSMREEREKRTVAFHPTVGGCTSLLQLYPDFESPRFQPLNFTVISWFPKYAALQILYRYSKAFVNKVKKYVPGALLSVGWSAHGGCVDALSAEVVRQDYTVRGCTSVCVWNYKHFLLSDIAWKQNKLYKLNFILPNSFLKAPGFNP
jgi:hypothetical protein